MSSATPILMPKLGLTMTEGLLSSWLVKPGDEIAAGDVLFVVETDKIATEVVAQDSGRLLEIKVPEGETVEVGVTVATWTGQNAGTDDSTTPDAAEAVAKTEPEPVKTSADLPAAAPRRGDRLLATPLARRMARERGVDLSTVTGTGPRGRIKAKDVMEGRPAPASPSSDMAPRARSRPPTPIEKVVARRLTEAKRDIPHFYVNADADVTKLLALAAELNADDTAPRVTVTHFIVKAVGTAMQRMPEVNILWTDDAIVEPQTVDIGIAVDTERGLLAPVLRGVESLTLDALARAATVLVGKARDGSLAAGDLEGGTISVSNIGMFGASYLTPIVNPGQSSILGVAGVRPVFRPDADGQPALRQEMGLVLSCDHRVLDGLRAAKFLNRIVELLENPLRLLRG